MATDYTTLIALVEAAITARLQGGAVDEYTIRGRNTKYSSLTELRELLAWLKREKAASTTTGGPFAYGVPGRAGGPP